jgi:hypothetical protein
VPLTVVPVEVPEVVVVITSRDLIEVNVIVPEVVVT